jgi:chromosome partitioning protein
MKIVSVINYKGGVGKTSLTANLGAQLAWLGHRVLLLDLDPQASLTFSFVKPDYWETHLQESRTIKTWFTAQMKATPIPLSSLIFEPEQAKKDLHGHGKLDLIASHLGLINLDLELATELGGASLSQAKERFVRVHRRLSEGLAELAQEVGDSPYDVVLIDCPPNFNITTKTALVASDLVVVPAKPDYLSTLGIDYLRRSITGLVRDYNDYRAHADETKTEMPPIDPKILGVIFTMVEFYSGAPIKAQAEFMAQVKRSGVPCFTTVMRENKSLFADAPQYGAPVVLHDPTNATFKNIVSELEALTNEFRTAAGLVTK